MGSLTWSYSTVNTWLECNRKYYFASVLPSFHWKVPLRRKAYELGSMQTLTMWKGSVVDKFMETVIIPLIQQKKEIDFDALATQAIELADRQFRFSENQLYRNPEIKKGKYGDEYCILDIHEIKRSFTAEEIEICYQDIRTAVLNIPKTYMPGNVTLLEFLSNANYLVPNVQNRMIYIGESLVRPQIDLVAALNWQPVIMDWKLSESYISDYARQLQISALVIYKKRLETEGQPPYKYSDFHLFEVNLLKAQVRQHDFNAEIANKLIDDISLTSSDIELLTNDTSVTAEDFQITDNNVSCKMCNFRALCGYLLINKQYDEGSYLKSLQN